MSNQSSAAWLLDDFKSGDIFFASPTQQFRARHGASTLSAYAPASRDTVAALFEQAEGQGNADPILFGLVPFDARNPASLSIPAQYQQAPVPDRTAPQSAPPSSGADASGAAASRPKAIDRQPVPAPEVYGDMVRRALELYAQGDVKKIVLSRAMDVTLDRPVDYEKLLPDLLARNAHGYTFAIPAWGIAGQPDREDTTTPAGAMLGASPELLVRREGARIFVNPLAGSIGRHADPEIDRARKEGLAISEKDLREHSYVVSDIVRILRDYCDELDVPDGPSVIGTDALWHLSTYITGTLRDPQVTALDLSCALHPTPAICGHPTDKAFEHIRELEPFERGYFAGLVGWQRANGDGEWALTLRCAMQTGERSLRLYAGAGTVAGSDPQSEITETATKMETFMRAIS